jgi:hypothetical protein
MLNKRDDPMAAEALTISILDYTGPEVWSKTCIAALCCDCTGNAAIRDQITEISTRISHSCRRRWIKKIIKI